MQDNNYWKTALAKAGRRRALIAAAGASLGAAFLAACGSGSGGDSKPKESSGLISPPVDTSKTAKRGGVLKASANTDVPTFDAFTVSVPNRQPVLGGYSRLLQLKPGYMQDADRRGDRRALAESWELALSIASSLTFKLRPSGRFNAPVAPVNGRAVDVDDVLLAGTASPPRDAHRGDRSSTPPNPSGAGALGHRDRTRGPLVSSSRSRPATTAAQPRSAADNGRQAR